MQSRIDPRLDPVKLRKRVLIFFFAAAVNLLMGVWVWSAGAQAGGGTVTIVALIFVGFASLNYYMARKLQKYLKGLHEQRGGVLSVPVEEEKK